MVNRQILTEKTFLPESELVVRDGANGPVNTKIRRYSTLERSVGTAIGISAAGIFETFTINKNGIYFLSASFSRTTSGAIGFSRNSTELSTDIENIIASTRLALNVVSGSGVSGVCVWTGFLLGGDIIRVHTNALGGANTLTDRFQITRIG